MKRPCPNCGQQTVLTVENPYRPFCSDRCRLIDLSRWFDESYSVPAEPASPSVPDAEEQ